MKAFLSRFHAFVRFVLCGFDRVRFCGESRLLNHAGGVQSYCLKFYDKDKIALRIETTINNPKEYKVFRTKEGEPGDAPKSWQQLRKGVADIERR